MNRAEKAQRIGEMLDELYPETPVPLNHSSAYTLLVAVMLSAQTTDKKVNQVTPALFAKASTPEQMATLAVDEIQMCTDHERGHIFTDRLLNARGEKLTMFLGSHTMKSIMSSLIKDLEFGTLFYQQL